jgi:RNA polymerase-binding protein DksA
VKAAKKATGKKAPAKQAPPKNVAATKAPDKRAAKGAGKAPAKTVGAKAAARPAPAKATTAKAPAKAAAKKVPASRSAGPKSGPAKVPAANATAPTQIAVPRGSDWTPAELAEVRAQLVAELGEMQGEYDRSMRDLDDLQRANSDGAGDDQADAGSKTFEREQELSIAANRLDLLAQIQRAVDRIDAGTYGYCESCGNPIPKARLKAFPMATLDVACKQREERR